MSPRVQSLFTNLTAGVLILLTGCAAQRASKMEIPAGPRVMQSAMRFRKEYVLTPGDQIEVNVRRFPEITRALAVRPDGLITLPLLNDVTAAGMRNGE